MRHTPEQQAQSETSQPFAQDWELCEWQEALEKWGYAPVHASRLFAEVHRRDVPTFASCDHERMPKRLLAFLDESSGLALSPVSVTMTLPSSDGSVKCLFQLKRGQQVEAIYMPTRDRVTLCISSQVGCAMGCTFCATGKMGLIRHLSAGEIVGQVNAVRQLFPDTQGQTRRWNIVFMGMGEPLHNLDQVMKACRILTEPAGLGLSMRHISISTSGLVPKIKELGQFEERPQLIVSVASTTDEARSKIMPVNRAYPLEVLFDCLASFPLRKREKIMLSYVLIDGVNDSDADAERLVGFARRFPSSVNLIPLNEHEQSPDMAEPKESRLQAFRTILLDQGVYTTVRRSRGRDVTGACGQLVTEARRKKSQRVVVSSSSS